MKKTLIINLIIVITILTLGLNIDNVTAATGTGAGKDGPKYGDSSCSPNKECYVYGTGGITAFGTRFSLYQYKEQKLTYLGSKDIISQNILDTGIPLDKAVNYTSKYKVYTCGGTYSGSLNYKYLQTNLLSDGKLKIVSKLNATVNTSIQPYATYNFKSTYDTFYNSVISYFGTTTDEISTAIKSIFGESAYNSFDEKNADTYYITVEPTFVFFRKDGQRYIYGTPYELAICKDDPDFHEYQGLKNPIFKDITRFMYNVDRGSTDKNNFTGKNKEALIKLLSPEDKVLSKWTDIYDSLKNDKTSPYAIAVFWVGQLINNCPMYCMENSDGTTADWSKCAKNYCESTFKETTKQNSCYNGCINVTGTCEGIPSSLDKETLSATCNGSTSGSAKSCYLGDDGYYRVICDEEVSTSKYPGITTHTAHDGSTSSFDYEYSLRYEKTCHIEWFNDDETWIESSNAKIPAKALAATLTKEMQSTLRTNADNALSVATARFERPSNAQIYIEDMIDGRKVNTTIWAKTKETGPFYNTTTGTLTYEASYSIGTLYRRTTGTVDYRTYVDKSLCEQDGSTCISTDGYYYVSYAAGSGSYDKSSLTSNIGTDGQWLIRSTCNYEILDGSDNYCSSTCSGLSGNELAKCATNYCSKYYLGDTSKMTTCLKDCNVSSNCISVCGNKTGTERKECANNVCGSTSNSCYQVCTIDEPKTACYNCSDSSCVNKEISKCTTEECKRSCCVTNCNIVYKDSEESINTCISNVCTTSPGTLYDKVLYRPINVNDPFPNNRKPGDNWWNKVEYITEETTEIDNKYYDSTSSNSNTYEYRFIITPSDMRTVSAQDNDYSEETVYFKYMMSTKVDRVGGISKEQAASLNTSPTYCSAFIHDYLIGQVLADGRYNVENGACK